MVTPKLGYAYRSLFMGIREYISQTAGVTYSVSEAACMFQDDVPSGFQFEEARMGYIVKDQLYYNNGAFGPKELAEKVPYPDFVRYSKKVKGCKFEDE